MITICHRAALICSIWSAIAYGAYIAPLCTTPSLPGTNSQLKLYPVVMPRLFRNSSFFCLPEALKVRRASITSVSNVAHFVNLVQTCYGIKVECAPEYFNVMPSDILDIFQQEMHIADATLLDGLDNFVRLCYSIGWPSTLEGFPVAVITPSNIIITTALVLPEFSYPYVKFDLFSDINEAPVLRTNKPSTCAGTTSTQWFQVQAQTTNITIR